MKPPEYWKCPHCEDGTRRLSASMDHIQAKHPECLFCSAEWLLLRSILEKKGVHWYQGIGHGHLLARE